MLFNFGKNILAQIKTNLLKTHLRLLKTKNLNCLHDVIIKNSISPNPMVQSVKSNSVKKFKAIASTSHAILHPYLRFFFEKRFLKKSGNSGLENLVIILQFE